MLDVSFVWLHFAACYPDCGPGKGSYAGALSSERHR